MVLQTTCRCRGLVRLRPVGPIDIVALQPRGPGNCVKVTRKIARSWHHSLSACIPPDCARPTYRFQKGVCRCERHRAEHRTSCEARRGSFTTLTSGISSASEFIIRQIPKTAIRYCETWSGFFVAKFQNHLPPREMHSYHV